MESSRVLSVPATTDGVRLAAEGFDAFAAEHGLSRHVTWPFQVALDELVSNVVHHGAGEGAGARIAIELRLADQHLEVVVVDEGAPFDPLQAPEPDTALPLEERPIGGLGLMIVKRLMDQVAYERAGGRNRLTIRRKLAVPEGLG
jgi:anti-sigma regulatory factor (Ser/Thr protein kinase)